MNQQFTLSELNQRIKDALFEAFPETVWVVAEVSELKENRSGHCYLELVEKKGNTITARSRATIWSYTYRMLKPYFETSTGQQFTSGIKILIQTTVEYHPVYGLSMNIKDIDPAYTVGDMAMHRKEIINRLQQEGVFDMNKELQMPLVTQKIAIISSATAAGYQDFMNQLNNNEYGIKFYTKLFEAYMQGTETGSSIIDALERIFQYDDFFDAVAIIRGGGATADLSSFDNYDLAINVTQFPLPVITGIGHEKDDTIIDLVANTRLKTPTAVAEFFVSRAENYLEQLLTLENELFESTFETLRSQNERLERLAEGLKFSVSSFINESQSLLTQKSNKLQQNVSSFVFKKQQEVNTIKHDIKKAVSIYCIENKNNIGRKQRILKRVVSETVLKQQINIAHKQDLLVAKTRNILQKEISRLELSNNTIRLLNPENILKRGFTLTLKNGKIVKSAKDIEIGEVIQTHFTNGNIESKITKK